MKPLPLRHAWAYWVPVVGYAGLIFALSSIHGRDLPESMIGFDKLLHLSCYFGLSFLILRAIACTKGVISRHGMALAILLAAFYGATDEWHQLYVPGRSADPWDLAADVLGAMFGTVGYVWFNDWLLRRVK